MDPCIRKFELGPYVGLSASGDNYTDFLDNLLNFILGKVRIELDCDLVEIETSRIEKQLRDELESEKKPVRLFCHMQGIDESQFRDFCRDTFKRTLAENALFESIAENEHISVNQDDVAFYKQHYQDSYIKAILSNETLSENDLESAILTKKILFFLASNNVWIRT